jgi:4-hydroxy-3-methylbut-2-enyl diphosphate reductase IspH
MEVIVAEKCGFCPGVRNAIRMAEEIVRTRKEVYSLGPIIHNRDVVEHLAEEGLRTVGSIDEVRSGTVLIRSHGAAPEEIERLREKGVEIVDATCVLVKRVQQIARELDAEGYRVVVIGDENHPEVRAVVGCARDVVVVAIGKHGFSEMKVINTLCREAINRQESAIELCKGVDIMFVLGGLESANTRRLAELCKKYNSQTFHLQNWGECDKRILPGKRRAGVTAGASTPEWIIEEFVRNLKAFSDEEA